MKKKLLNRKIVLLIILIIFTLTVGISYGLGESNNDTPLKVEENSNLTYYLEIMYDGNDKNLVTSSNSTTAEIYSDTINIEDTLPNGLIFKNFVKSSNESIGSVKRSDGTPCSGYVVGGYNGLKYDEQSRKVSFTIKDLKAGCKLTVGIVTQTPKFSDYNIDRIDFYNTAYATENKVTVSSQTLHSYMQNASAQLYSVNYEYTGDVPDNAPDIHTKQYVHGQTIGVESVPSIHGYTFSGWTSEDVQVNNGTFIMPNKNITFTGKFTKIPDYKVTYIIEGDTPDNYIVPVEKKYIANEIIALDSTPKGKEYGDYIFNGWILPNNIRLNNNEFIMPNNDIVIKGSFTKKKLYTVKYKFVGNYIPKNYAKLLPKTQTYAEGDTVSITKINNKAVCKYRDSKTYKNCKFEGWSIDKDFTMADENIVITGKWNSDDLVFTPSIEKKIIEKKNHYKKNEKVRFIVNITNNDNVTLYNVKLKEKLKGASFVSGDGYNIVDNDTVIIPKINPYEEFSVYSEYLAGNDIYTIMNNEVLIVSAKGSNNYILNPDKQYIAKASFVVANPFKKSSEHYLKIIKVDDNDNALSGAEFTLYSDSKLSNSLQRGLSFDNLKANTTYYLKETTVPIGYVDNGKVYKVIIDEKGNISIPNLEVVNEKGAGTVKIVNNKLKEYVPSKSNTIVQNPKTNIKKKKTDYKPYVIGGVGTTGTLFIFLLLFFRRKRTIMIFMPEIDVNKDIDFVNNKLAELDSDTIKNNKARIIIMSNNNYYEYKDNKCNIIEYKIKNFEKNMMLAEFIRYSYKKFKAKRYNLVIINKIISMTDLISGLKSSNINEGAKLDSIILRYSEDLDNNIRENLRKYSEVICYTKEGYKEFDINKFIYSINLINNRADGKEVGKIFKEQYDNSLGIVNPNTTINYIIEELNKNN